MALNALLDACLRGNDDFSFCHSTRFLHQLELGNTSLYVKGQSISCVCILLSPKYFWYVADNSWFVDFIQIERLKFTGNTIQLLKYLAWTLSIFYNMLILYIFYIWMLGC